MSRCPTQLSYFLYLVDDTESVLICPAGLVQVIRLLQHLRQLLASNVPVEQLVNLVTFGDVCYTKITACSKGLTAP